MPSNSYIIRLIIDPKHIRFFIVSAFAIIITTYSNIITAGLWEWLFSQPQLPTIVINSQTCLCDHSQEAITIFPIKKAPPEHPTTNPFQERDFPDCMKMEYTLLEYLGQGKDGHVFLCRRTVDNLPVAVKAMANIQYMDHDTVKRSTQLFREGFLNRRGIVKIFDDFISDDSFWHIIIQEWLPENIIEFAPLSPLQTKAFLVELLDIITYCHSENIVHRDIKPDNLFISLHDRLTVIDWESSKMLPPEKYGIVDLKEFDDGEYTVLSSEADSMLSTDMSNSIVFTPGYTVTGGSDSPFIREYQSIVITTMELILGQENAPQIPGYNKNKSISENLSDILSSEPAPKEQIYQILNQLNIKHAHELSEILNILFKNMEPDKALESTKSLLQHPYFDEVKYRICRTKGAY